MSFRTVSRGLSTLLRGTNQQTNTGLIHLNGLLSGRDNSDAAQRVQGYSINYARIHNRSGGATFAGFGVRLPNRLWQAGLVDDGVYTDDTADLQDTDTNDFAMAVDADNNTGFAILSAVPFNFISLNVTTQDAGTQTGAIKYSKGTGSTLGTITNAYVSPPAQWASGENIVGFEPPTDWAKTDGTELTGVPSGMYLLVVEETTAAVTAALAKAGEIFYLPIVQEAVADNGVLEFAPGCPLAIPYGDALVAYIGSVSAIQSVATFSFSPGTAFGGN